MTKWKDDVWISFELKKIALDWYNAEKKQLQEDMKKYNIDLKWSRYCATEKRINEIDDIIRNIII